MTNFRDKELIEADLSELYSADVPDLRFEQPRTGTVPSGGRWARLFRRHWRPAVVGAGVAVALAVALIAPALRGGDSQTVSAAEVFERASTAAASGAPEGGARNYHMVATSQMRGVDDTFTTETWYGGKGRYRVENTGPDGYRLGQVVNGEDAWMYMTIGGVTGAAHGPSASIGVDVTGDYLVGQQSLADVINQFGKTCQSASDIHEGTLAGRSVYEIVVTPQITQCPSEADSSKAASLAGKSLALWVDQETFLTLKTEQRDVDGTVAYSQTATEFDASPEMPDSTFTYEAPPGVSIIEVNDVNQAKEAISLPLSAGNATAPQPTCEVQKSADGSPAADEC